MKPIFFFNNELIFMFFKYIFVGMMVEEIQGHHLPYCGQVIHEANCALGNCQALCQQQYKGGIGVCLKTKDGSIQCLCNHDCIS